MGYDMYMVEAQQDKVATEDAWAKLQAAVTYRDTLTVGTPEHTSAQHDVDTLHDAWRATQTDYFRLNIWGMSDYRTHMDKLNMMHYEPGKPWPTTPISDDIICALRDAANSDTGQNDPDWQTSHGQLTITSADVSAYDQYTGAIADHLKANDDTLPGINAEKFSSNDGWHVTANECASAIAHWNAASDAQQKETIDTLGPYWLEWIDFLTRATKQDGFTVY